jgi:1-acyl-sn-glycerol-3-phosphate acyltransferase
MLDQPSPPPEPIADVWRPDLVGLPELTFARRAFRLFARTVTKLLALLLLRAEVSSMENFPRQGPAVLVFNHLGDADVALMLSALPLTIPVEGIGKIELNEHWFVGRVFRAYGIIWVHRGQPDRKALRAALDGLGEGRMILLAPEGRQSIIGGLDQGRMGAAFLALKSGAPIVPMALTGTENSNFYGHLKQGRRARVTLKVGKPFFLPLQASRQKTMQEGTRLVMETLADLLPESYRGKYGTGS